MHDQMLAAYGRKVENMEKMRCQTETVGETIVLGLGNEERSRVSVLRVIYIFVALSYRSRNT